MQNLKKLSLIAAVAAVSLSASWSLAATAVWDGGTAGNGTDWGTAANWRPDVAPVAGDSVQFNATNSTTGNTVVTNGSTSVTGINGTGAFQVGQTVTGTGIQAGTTIVSIDSNSAITLSLPATVSGTPQLTIANTGGLASSPTLALGASQTINTLNQYYQAANFGIGTAGDIS